ncbi:HEAT repeat domain-containing protein [Fontisphaera persica]|uniref:HEAT repeat domain-containing protein n=1 Tax=Fontisphaera persica TaxID=2974023 RepID=UPI0024C05EA1|nr:HEAT repeat domain-containing protein [Fontisphaera persica]WCJ59860.1 HEAT repeat domain-containing protein [Fontisphaera persica]
MADNTLDIKALVEQMPEVDKPGTPSKFTGPAWSEAEPIYQKILGGGDPALKELLGLVKDPADPGFANYKAEYVLHGLVVYVGRPEQLKHKERLAGLLASAMLDANYSKATRGLFIRELQWIAGPAQVNDLARLAGDEELGLYALACLEAVGRPAVRALTRSLSQITGRNLVGAIQALGRWEVAEAAPALRRLLFHQDQDVRLAAGWALARLGEASDANRLLKMADAANDYEKIKMTDACLLLAEKLAATGKPREAVKIYQHFQRTRTDPKERHLKEAAEKALTALNVAF